MFEQPRAYLEGKGFVKANQNIFLNLSRLSLQSSILESLKNKPLTSFKLAVKWKLASFIGAMKTSPIVKSPNVKSPKLLAFGLS